MDLLRRKSGVTYEKFERMQCKCRDNFLSSDLNRFNRPLAGLEPDLVR